jgi:hypothetical protein
MKGIICEVVIPPRLPDCLFMRCVLYNVGKIGRWLYIKVAIASSTLAAYSRQVLRSTPTITSTTSVVYAPAAAAVVPTCTTGNQHIADIACMAHSCPEGWATECRFPFHIMTNQPDHSLWYTLAPKKS